MIVDNSLKLGVFVTEVPNRFLCIIKIDGVDEECYVPSSYRIDNMFNLTGKMVYVAMNKSEKSRTKYRLVGTYNEEKFVLFDSNKVNEIVATAIIDKKILADLNIEKIKKEVFIENYKTDIYLPELNTIIEIKSSLSIDTNSQYPSVHSERGINQINRLIDIVGLGYKVIYIFIALNTDAESISINNMNGYLECYKKLIEKGMLSFAFSINFIHSELTIDKQIPLLFD